jgi:hypothetical protein
VGGGAGVLAAVISLARSSIHKMRSLAQESLRKQYGDQHIYVMGQQTADMFSSEDCWAYVNKVGGTIWVQNVNITRRDALAFVAAIASRQDPGVARKTEEFLSDQSESHRQISIKFVPRFKPRAYPDL